MGYGDELSPLVAEVDAAISGARRMSQGDWTDDRVDIMRQMHARGDSFGKIGHALNMSRNSCIGKARRLGLSPREPRNQNWMTEQATKKRLANPPPKVAPPMPEPMPQPAPLELPPCDPVRLIDATFRSCRWPLWDDDGAATGFPICGRKRDWDSSWCAAHRARVFQAKKQAARTAA